MYLDVLADVALEAAVHDLALPGLEAVDHAGDGALQVCPREQDQLLRAGLDATISANAEPDHSQEHQAYRQLTDPQSMRSDLAAH